MLLRLHILTVSVQAWFSQLFSGSLRFKMHVAFHFCTKFAASARNSNLVPFLLLLLFPQVSQCYIALSAKMLTPPSSATSHLLHLANLLVLFYFMFPQVSQCFIDKKNAQLLLLPHIFFTLRFVLFISKYETLLEYYILCRQLRNIICCAGSFGI
jgi:hypothetical protein